MFYYVLQEEENEDSIYFNFSTLNFLHCFNNCFETAVEKICCS